MIKRPVSLYTFLQNHELLNLTLHENEAGELLVHAGGGDPGQTIYVSCLLREEVEGYTYEVQKLPTWGWVVCLHPVPLDEILDMRTAFSEKPLSDTELEGYRGLRWLGRHYQEAQKKPKVQREAIGLYHPQDIRLALMIEGGREV